LIESFFTNEERAVIEAGVPISKPKLGKCCGKS